MSQDDAVERAAFHAGFDASSEGSNGEYGPSAEWIDCLFENWKYGTPVPDRCHAESPTVAHDGYKTGCRRPAGHATPHRDEQAREWD